MMKQLYSVAGMILLLSAVSYGIGSQHGVFRSQSTQGVPWQGSAEITQEHFDITVYPDYLDVELEWVFKAGGVEPDSFKNALEIVGNLNLAEHSTIIGMITWYKGKILKGKLKTDSIAREQYENVVDRASERPQPPRDPVLLEYGWGKDNYDISIFPVAFNSTRKVRIRYLIPAFNIDGVNKIGYPYAFTSNATVNIRRGAGVMAYIIEAGKSKKQFENTSPVALDKNEYSLQAYGSSSGQPVSCIVPVMSNVTDGSIIYSGSFSTPKFSGEVCHVKTMSAEMALKRLQIAEDFVILWRWNHPQILAKYARQIVEQSTMLKKFLSTLESANKRAALIIDKEGGETITFHLDRKGGHEFKRLIGYLDSLSIQTVFDPPMSSTPKNVNIEYDAAGELKEFETAIQAAMELFDKKTATLKHLLILTAGPQLLSVSQAVPGVSPDSTIDVRMLSGYLSGEDYGSSVTTVNPYYWPGVNLSGFVNEHGAKLSVCATVVNGKDSSRIQVLAPPAAGCNYCTGERTTEMHLYSNKPLLKEIRWSIYKGNDLFASYTESPEVINLADGMQYGRLIGSSRHLVPLADKMPSSIASSLGFIDKKYSLVTLEEDSLPASVASQYEVSGVPCLNPEDIFAAPGERTDMPVSEWLIANPPEPMKQNGAYFPIQRVAAGGLVVMDMMAFPNPAAPDAKRVAGNTPAGMALPMAPTINGMVVSYPDYMAPLSVKDATKRNRTVALKEVPVLIRNGNLVIELSKLAFSASEPVNIVLYDCAGRLIGRWNCSSSRDLSISMKSFARGSYMLRVYSRSLGSLQKLVVR